MPEDTLPTASPPTPPTSPPDASFHVSDPAIETRSVRSNLSHRAVRSGLFTVAAQPLKLAFGAGALVVLARVLNPSDFGLLAMTVPLVGFVMAALNVGVETAIIQREDLTPARLNAVYWWSLVVNAGILAAMAAAGPGLAWFFGEPALTGITLALTGGLLVMSLTMAHEALVKRRMRFGTLAGLQVTGSLAGAAGAVAAALLGAGYWALVVQVIAPQVVVGAGCWLACSWRPGRPDFRLDASTRAMVAYGGSLTGSRLISRAAMNFDRLVIGYTSGAAVLGLYDVGRRWGYLPLEKAYEPVSSVAVAVFSRSQSRPDRYRAAFRTGLLPAFSLVIPLLVFAWLEAETLVLYMLGAQWLEAVPLLRILIPGFLALGISKVTKWLYMAEGTTARQLRWGLYTTPVQIGALLLGAPWGAVGVAWGLTLSTIALAPPAITYCLRGSAIRGTDFLRTLWRPVLSVTAATAAYAALPVIAATADHVVQLGPVFMRTAVFGAVYAMAWVLLPGGRLHGSALLALVRNGLRP